MFLNRYSRGLSTIGRSMSSVSIDMTRNLKIKAVAIDLNIIIETNPNTQSKSSKPTAEISKPITSTPPAKELTQEEKEIFNILGPQAKYADKIKLKLAKNITQRANPATDSLKLAMQGSSTRWLLAEGMGDVLDYIHNRTVKVVAVGAPREFNDATINQLKSQLNQTRLSYVRPYLPTQLDANGEEIPLLPGDIQSHQTQYLQQIEQQLNINKNQVLLVSSDESLLSEARDRGYYTCRYR